MEDNRSKIDQINHDDQMISGCKRGQMNSKVPIKWEIPISFLWFFWIMQGRDSGRWQDQLQRIFADSLHVKLHGAFFSSNDHQPNAYTGPHHDSILTISNFMFLDFMSIFPQKELQYMFPSQVIHSIQLLWCKRLSHIINRRCEFLSCGR